MTACTCHPCGRDFTGLGPFDAHQQVDYDRRPAVVCLDPATIGMQQNAHGRWGFRMTDERREQLAALRQPSGSDAPSRALAQTQSAQQDHPKVMG